MPLSSSSRNSLIGVKSRKNKSSPMITFSSILMTKALICGIAFISTPMPTSPSSSAARIGIASFTARSIQARNSSMT